MKAKRLLTAIAAIALILTLSLEPALSAERIAKLAVGGMHSAEDEARVSAALDEMEGISDYTIDLDESTAVVAFDDEATSLDAIREAVEGNSYSVEEASFLCD